MVRTRERGCRPTGWGVAVLRAINNARIVTPENVVEGGSLILEEGRIAGISARSERSGEIVDAAGRYVLPGIVDLHSDAVEKQLEPRPGVAVPEKLAFLEMDRYFASSGITTGFHAISFMEDRNRSLARGRRLCDMISRFRSEGSVRHEIHLRCELPEEGSLDVIEDLVAAHPVRIVSMMDHTPGQGQFRDLEWFRRYWREDIGMDEGRISAAIAEAENGEYRLALDRVERIAKAAKQNGTVLASHDDDTEEKVEMLAEHGVRISEFPVTAEAAQQARDLGLTVCMGAPNALRGTSSGGNLSALKAIESGLVDALCSDYHPPSMLQAAFRLANERILDLPAAIRLISSGPARAAGLPDHGEIRENATADVLVVGERLGLPIVTHTIVDGRVAFSAWGLSNVSKVGSEDRMNPGNRTVGGWK